MALVLHDHPRSSNSPKVRFLLAELDLPHERRNVPLARSRPDWHVALNAAGGIPVLVDDGFALAASHAILRYLATEDVYPAERRARARIDWLLELIAGPLREANHRIAGPAFGWRPRLRHAGALDGRVAVWAAAVHARPAWSAVASEADIP